MSALEDKFAHQLKMAQVDPAWQREMRFHPERRWRFDFAWVKDKLAVELQGGTFINGRHSRGKGFQGDCDKFNAATLLGWRILKFTAQDVNKGIALQTTIEALGSD